MIGRIAGEGKPCESARNFHNFKLKKLSCLNLFWSVDIKGLKNLNIFREFLKQFLNAIIKK